MVIFVNFVDNKEHHTRQKCQGKQHQNSYLKSFRDTFSYVDCKFCNFWSSKLSFFGITLILRFCFHNNLVRVWKLQLVDIQWGHQRDGVEFIILTERRFHAFLAEIITQLHHPAAKADPEPPAEDALPQPVE